MWHVANGEGARSVPSLCGTDQGVPRIVFNRKPLQRSCWRGLAGGRSAGMCGGPSTCLERSSSARGSVVGCAGGEAGGRPFQHPVIALNWGRWAVAVPFGRDGRPRPRAFPIRRDSMAHVPTEQCQPSQLGQAPVAIPRHMAYLTLPASLALSCHFHHSRERRQLFAVVFIRLRVVAPADSCNK